MAKIPIVYNESVKFVQMPKQDVGEWLSDCLEELTRLWEGGPVRDQTHELINAVNGYFDLVEKEYLDGQTNPHPTTN